MCFINLYIKFLYIFLKIEKNLNFYWIILLNYPRNLKLRYLVAQYITEHFFMTFD